MVAHGHFQVNGRKVSIPSFLVKVGDVVQLRTTSKLQERVADNLSAGRGHVPQWLELDGTREEGDRPEPAAPRRHPDSGARSSSSSSCTRSKRGGRMPRLMFQRPSRIEWET